MRVRCFLTFIAVVLFAGPAASASMKVDLELILAVDISESIDQEEAQLQRDGYVAALRSKEVVAAITSGFYRRIAITYIEWAGAYFGKTVVDWTVISGQADAEAFAAKVASAPIRTEFLTSISAAVLYAIPLFDNQYDGARRVIDVSGDGANNAGPPVVVARDAAEAAGITVNGLPIINRKKSWAGYAQIEHLDYYFEDCVIAGPDSFIIVAKSRDDFAAAVQKKLVREIASAPARIQNASFTGADSGVLLAARGKSRKTRVRCDEGERRLKRSSLEYRQWLETARLNRLNAMEPVDIRGAIAERR